MPLHVTPEAVAPQSFQQELMSSGKLRCPNPGWNMLLPWRLTGPLDRAALLDALDAVVRRHEVLRTTFASSDGEPVQVVRSHQPLDIGELDLRSLADDARAAGLDRVARQQHALSLDHEQGPLLVGSLVQTATDDHHLLLTIDHAVCDGWSIGALLAELSAHYNGTITGRGARLWPLPAQYRDFSTEQRRLAASGAHDDQLAWWAEQLEPGPAPLGLAYQPPSGAHGYRSGQHPVVVPAEVTHRLRGLGRRLRGTLFMVLLTALTGALGQHTRHGDVAVTSLVAGRRRAEHQRLIGMFANPVVQRTSTAGAGSFAGLLDRVRRTVVAANDRQDAPFPLVAERAGVRAAEIWLNVAPPPALTRFRGLVVDTQALPRDYPIEVPAGGWRGEMLICNLTDTGTEIVGLLDYNRNRLDPATVAGLADAFLALLADAVRDPSRPLPAVGSRPDLY